MSVEKTKLDFFSKRKIDEEQVLVESILNVPDAQKILWVEAAAQVETVDAMTKEASFSGQVFLMKSKVASRSLEHLRVPSYLSVISLNALKILMSLSPMSNKLSL